MIGYNRNIVGNGMKLQMIKSFFGDIRVGVSSGKLNFLSYLVSWCQYFGCIVQIVQEAEHLPAIGTLIANAVQSPRERSLGAKGQA